MTGLSIVVVVCLWELKQVPMGGRAQLVPAHAVHYENCRGPRPQGDDVKRLLICAATGGAFSQCCISDESKVIAVVSETLKPRA